MFQIDDPLFQHALTHLEAGDTQSLSAHLAAHPELAHQRIALAEAPAYFQNPTLLAFIAENPIRKGTLPANVVEVAAVILEAGTKKDAAAISETLALVASGCVSRESDVQIQLIDLLCGHRADPDLAILPALTHGEFQAAHALIRNGARIDIAVAAALGQTSDAHLMLDASSPDERHRALAFAAQFGRLEIVRLLLDSGEDPSRYNPAGLHAHATPLHQAAHAGHFEVVRLLVERGASLDLADTLWYGTPEGWATHANHAEIANWLRTQHHRP